MKRLIGLIAIAAAAAVAGTAQATSVGLSGATATYEQSAFGVSWSIDGSIDNLHGWAIHPFETTAQSAVFQAATTPASSAAGTDFTFTLSQIFDGGNSNFYHTIGKFKLSVTTDASPDTSSAWHDLTGVSFSAVPSETPVSVGSDGTILLAASSPTTSVYTVEGSTSLLGITGFRLQVIPDASLPAGGSGRQPSNGNFVLSEFQVDAVPLVPSGQAVPLPAAVWGGLSLMAGLGLYSRRKRSAIA